MADQKDVVDAVSTALRQKDLSQQAVKIVHRSTEKVLKRLQQDFVQKLKEDGDNVVEKFCANLADKLGKMSQTWYDSVTSELMVYPEGTRYIQREGAKTVIVVEQQPQCRTVNLSGENAHLAFPYVIFVLGFNEGRWDGRCSVAMRPTPITSLTDDLFSISLPNTDNYSVCMGEFTPKRDSNMTQQANEIIASFWTSQFGGLSCSDWKKKTKENPLFILKDASRYYKIGPLNTLIYNTASRASGTAKKDILLSLKQEIVTAVAAVGVELQKSMLSVDMVKQNKEKVQIETLDEILKEIIVQAYSELWEYLQAQLGRERQKMQAEMSVTLANMKARATSTW